MDLSVKLSGITLQNPVIPASGCCGFGHELRPFYDINILGGLALKGSTLEPRFGNELPRVAETSAGMLNSVGLQNPGIEAVAQAIVPALAKDFHQPILANVSGFSLEEFVKSCEIITQCDAVSIIELNISCPNVRGGGMIFGTCAQAAAEIVAACKAVVTKPLYVKLTPNVTNIAEVAKACEAAGADGLSLINTLLGLRIDLKSRKPVMANKMGGLSGPAIFPVALRCVWQVYQAVQIPIIGLGGVSSARDVIEMMLAGATAVQVGAANLVNPMVCKEIIDDLPAEMEWLGIEKLTDIIGGAHA
ncbi:MAG: dihydroorotate dehydrogenase [Oscillospiraceae bacterium]|jgi:dihydroorotate dehydrogenase (NAD+) catalytic subunit|nr:dihydroorotate dehydrogenase [Oscillospiraceae bacterium]